MNTTAKLAVRYTNANACGGFIWVGLWVGVFGVTSDNSFRKNGEDDETRTRDLCRDRVTVRYNLVILNGADSPSLVF